MSDKRRMTSKRVAQRGELIEEKIMKRRIVEISLAAAAFISLSMLGADALVNRASRGRTFSDVRAVPHRRVGLLLGCVKTMPGGWLNPFFTRRVAAAAELYRAGKVDYLLVSGDNHIRSYNEAKDMKDSLAELGVPREKIFCDYAGFRTLDSIVRARDVFGEAQITVISQEFHNRRAIFIASNRGIDAIGFNASGVGAYHGFKVRCREELARVNTVLDIYLFRRQPRFQGPRVPVGPVPQNEPV